MSENPDWQQIVLQVSGPNIAVVEDALLEKGALSISLLDAKDQPLLEPLPGEMPTWDHTILKALFSGDHELEPIVQQLCQSFSMAPEQIQVEVMKDEVWERVWMDQFEAMSFGKRLWIVPTTKSIPDEADTVIRLDPGLAFGTGTHATTALCLRWLDEHFESGKTVLDFGCGSGVLALAAAKLGAEQIDAIDIDPQALTATQNNAVLNGVASRVSTFSSEAQPDKSYPLILANILAGPLCQMAEHLCGRLQTGGDLVLSGILQDQVDMIQQHYGPILGEGKIQVQDEWVRVHFRKA